MVQLQTYSNAILVKYSSYCNIPNPSLKIVSNATTSLATNQLICANVDFIAAGVKVGDIVYNNSGSSSTTDCGATVIGIIDANTLELNNTPFLGVAENFTVYAGDQNEGSKSGCVLIVGVGATVTGTATTTSGAEVDLSIMTGSAVAFVPYIIPIQIRKISWVGSVQSVYALW